MTYTYIAFYFLFLPGRVKFYDKHILVKSHDLRYHSSQGSIPPPPLFLFKKHGFVYWWFHRGDHAPFPTWGCLRWMWWKNICFIVTEAVPISAHIMMGEQWQIQGDIFKDKDTEVSIRQIYFQGSSNVWIGEWGGGEMWVHILEIPCTVHK